jgi:amino acid transporter
MLDKFKYIFTGSPLPSDLMAEKRLNKARALAAFSPDALASVAYANQEIYLGLLAAGAAGLILQFPISLAIAILLVIVTLSYAQTILAYPNGGGSYVVARSNLGTLPGLVAGGALLLDYILNAAVSLTAGVAAIASAFPAIWPYRVELAIVLLVLITLINLRGLRETGTALAVPVYLFLVTFIGMLVIGIVRLLTGSLSIVPMQMVAPPAFSPLTLFIVMHSFAAGCTALTGIESISNGVPTFRPPEAQNARITLVVMAILMGFMFVGSVGLTQFLGVIAAPDETILSALAHRILGSGLGYYLVQFTTLGILTVAVNTSFAGFPRVAAILSSDRFLPRQLSNVGDRLVFTNGILLLAGISAILIFAFNGETHALVPLFAVGAFSAFTLSQAGMVLHWFHEHTPGWQLKSFINGLGAFVTALTLVVISISKFREGAWISILVIPLLVILFLRINRHYRSVSSQLSLRGLPPSLRPTPRPRVVIPVSGVHRGMVDAVNFSRSISDNVTAVFIDIDPSPDEIELRRKWEAWFPDVKLEIVPSPYRSMVEPLLAYLEQTDLEHNDGQPAVLVLPELITARPWNGILHNQSAMLIKEAILYDRHNSGYNRIIIDVPYHLRDKTHSGQNLHGHSKKPGRTNHE